MRTAWYRTICALAALLLLGTVLTPSLRTGKTGASAASALPSAFDGPYPYPPVPW